MSGRDETEVLVVGAGPVGMLTALCLGRAGVGVSIIDDEWRTAAHTYACALHPGTLQLLDRLGLAADALALGQRIETIAFYEGAARRAEMRLAELPVQHPYVLAMSQSALEDLLEDRLHAQYGVQVGWNHRISDLMLESDTVLATLDKLGGTAKGHIVPHWEMVVKKKLEMRAAFVVGADGHDSWVRRRLEIGCDQAGPPEVYSVHEFETDAQLGGELRVVLGEVSTDALWPLADGMCRWSCQLVQAELGDDFPTKDRSPFWLYDEAEDKAIRERVERQLRKRAPWFAGSVGEVHWSTAVQFDRRVATQFGRGRCWLAGDAAHQTGPVGVHSLNVGLREADDLARRLKEILREEGPLDLLEDYDRSRRHEWQRLLGARGELLSRASTRSWAHDRRRKILPCVPASGEDLGRLLGQVGLELVG